MLAGTCVQACSTLLPQGSSDPAAAPLTPRVTLPSEATSIPPSGPAFAVGLKRAVPGLPCSVRSVSCFSGSKIRGGSDESSLSYSVRYARFVSGSKTPAGSDERSLPCRWSTVSPLCSSKAPAGIVCRSLPSNFSSISVSSSPSNTPAGSAVRSLLLRINRSIPPRSAKSPGLSVAMPALFRLSVPVSAGRCTTGITSEQSVTSLSFALTSSTSLSRSWAVRLQLPPVSAGSPGDPVTLWPLCASSASWSRIATAPLASTIAPSLPSARLFAPIAMPSPSASPSATVYSNTSRLGLDESST